MHTLPNRSASLPPTLLRLSLGGKKSSQRARLTLCTGPCLPDTAKVPGDGKLRKKSLCISPCSPERQSSSRRCIQMETHQEELSCVTVMVEAEQWHLLPAGRRPRQAADDSELKPAHWQSRRREREPQSWAGDPGPAQAGRQEMDRGSLSLLFVPPRAVYFESKTNLMRKPFGAHAPVTFPLGTPVASPRTHPVSLPAPTHLPARSLLLLPPAGQQTPSTCQETSPFRPPSRFSPARLRPGGIPHQHPHLP